MLKPVYCTKFCRSNVLEEMIKSDLKKPIIFGQPKQSFIGNWSTFFLCGIMSSLHIIKLFDCGCSWSVMCRKRCIAISCLCFVLTSVSHLVSSQFAALIALHHSILSNKFNFWIGVGLNMFLLHLLAWYCKAACTKCQVPPVGVIEEGSTERVRISPASPTGLKKNTPEFMEKASVFSG